MTFLEKTVNDPSLRWRRRSRQEEKKTWEYKDFGERVESADDYEYVVGGDGGNRDLARKNAQVSLRLLYQRGALLALAVAIMSIILWLLAAAPIINPFLSIMVIAMSPFVYLMGKIERK